MRYRKRIETLKKSLQADGLDGLLITKKENIIYLCGFDGGDSALLVTSGDRDFVITDSIFKEEAEEELSDFKIKLTDGSRYKIINDILKKEGIRRFGFESDWLKFSDYRGLKRRLKRIEFVPKRYLVENLRIIKDSEEIDLIKRSVAIVKKAYSYVKKKIRPRLNGEELAVLIDNFMRKAGANRPAFQTIVVQNPYSSHPHGQATKRAFGKGSAVVVDMGAVFRGYNSDLTRVIFLGRISSKFKRIYNILKQAQEKAIKKIAPGISASEIDRVARQHIASKGLGKYFLHGLGHGIGLEIHEPPKISKKRRGLLRPGMVFTVEPGIYIRGWGGLRLEDMVVVTKNGCEVLTGDIPK